LHWKQTEQGFACEVMESRSIYGSLILTFNLAIPFYGALKYQSQWPCGLKNARTLRSRFTIPLEALIYVRILLCSVVLYRYRLRDGKVPRTWSPTETSKRIHKKAEMKLFLGLTKYHTMKTYPLLN